MTSGKFLRRFAALLCVLLLLFTMTTGAMAYTMVTVDKTCSLNVTFSDGDRGFEGVEFRVYKVAAVTPAVRFTLTPEFETYAGTVDLGHLDNMDADGWRTLANTLSGLVEKDGLAPTAKAVTNAGGQAKFENLTTGLYLVLGDSVRAGNTIYDPAPFLVTLPQLMADDTWNYDGEVAVKFDKEVIPPDETVKIKVIKIWDDNGWEGRPEEIVVTLLRDGKVYDTVILSAKNNWRYEWSHLPAGHRWQVVEEVPDGYTVTVDRDGSTFVIENTHETPPAPPEPELPSTGQLWWPVLVLAIGGLILLVAGLRLRRKGHEA